MPTLTEKFRLRAQVAAQASDQHPQLSPSRAFHQGRATAFEDVAEALDDFEQSARQLLSVAQRFEADSRPFYSHQGRGLAGLRSAVWHLENAIRHIDKENDRAHQ